MRSVLPLASLRFPPSEGDEPRERHNCWNAEYGKNAPSVVRNDASSALPLLEKSNDEPQYRSNGECYG